MSIKQTVVRPQRVLSAWSILDRRVDSSIVHSHAAMYHKGDLYFAISLDPAPARQLSFRLPVSSILCGYDVDGRVFSSLSIWWSGVVRKGVVGSAGGWWLHLKTLSVLNLCHLYGV